MINELIMPMNSKTKPKYLATCSPFQSPDLIPAATVVCRRDLLETKRSILKKLYRRLNKEDCICS
jgi:hypothetical protein